MRLGPISITKCQGCAKPQRKVALPTTVQPELEPYNVSICQVKEATTQDGTRTRQTIGPLLDFLGGLGTLTISVVAAMAAQGKNALTACVSWDFAQGC